MSISKAILSKIHIAKQQLAMDDDIYRGLLARVAGVRSAKELNERQAGAVLREFERLGFKPLPSKRTKGKPHNFNQLPGEIEVIEAQLADMKLSWSYADSIAKQMFGIPKVAWLKRPEQFKAVLAALHVEQEKRGFLEQVETLCQELGVTGPEMVAGLEQLPKGWQRQRPILKLLVETLSAIAFARREV